MRVTVNSNLNVNQFCTKYLHNVSIYYTIIHTYILSRDSFGLNDAYNNVHNTILYIHIYTYKYIYYIYIHIYIYICMYVCINK